MIVFKFHCNVFIVSPIRLKKANCGRPKKWARLRGFVLPSVQFAQACLASIVHGWKSSNIVTRGSVLSAVVVLDLPQVSYLSQVSFEVL